MRGTYSLTCNPVFTYNAHYGRNFKLQKIRLLQPFRKIWQNYWDGLEYKRGLLWMLVFHNLKISFGERRKANTSHGKHKKWKRFRNRNSGERNRSSGKSSSPGNRKILQHGRRQRGLWKVEIRKGKRNCIINKLSVGGDELSSPFSYSIRLYKRKNPNASPILKR